MMTNLPDVVNTGPLSNIWARPEHESFCELARLLVDRGQALTAANESEQQHITEFHIVWCIVIDSRWLLSLLQVKITSLLLINGWGVFSGPV